MLQDEVDDAPAASRSPTSQDQQIRSTHRSQPKTSMSSSCVAWVRPGDGFVVEVAGLEAAEPVIDVSIAPLRTVGSWTILGARFSIPRLCRVDREPHSPPRPVPRPVDRLQSRSRSPVLRLSRDSSSAPSVHHMGSKQTTEFMPSVGSFGQVPPWFRLTRRGLPSSRGGDGRENLSAIRRSGPCAARLAGSTLGPPPPC
jgi:hypothetical protein